jgi:hypothetical protein
VPRIRDHDPRYCARCQFWFAFNRAAGAVVGVVAAVLALAIVIGGLAVGAFFGYLYLSDNPETLQPLGRTAKYLAEVFSLILAGMGGVLLLSVVVEKLNAWSKRRRQKQPAP